MPRALPSPTLRDNGAGLAGGRCWNWGGCFPLVAAKRQARFGPAEGPGCQVSERGGREGHAGADYPGGPCRGVWSEPDLCRANGGAGEEPSGACHPGAGTALLGKEGAMACTVAVEESISQHYNNQIRVLMEEDPEKYKELLEVLKKFRDEEMEHHDTGLAHDAEMAPAYSLLKNVIQAGCKAAIYVSERI
ncbi:NADPH-dependent 3-demethoxyubiquinone 3-hydroxylase, mitochondrial isoform X2 [Mustelus asterias]